ncbi:MAG: porin [Alphaproteobacteria bacterium]|nr:porin [Alphaproteobacteria bacterium]MDE2336816.1 porin [Alphaproteobacteria bacterium]
MKKLLIASTALVGVAFMATSAHAALKMDLGGYFDGYGVYADNHPAAGTNLAKYEFTKDSEMHVNGETTLDNGLTVGAHYQMYVADTAANGTAITANTKASLLASTSNQFPQNAVNGTIVDEAYIYGSGGWGRVNFGEEDGAAYLLQVAAPSADSNVDGLRTYVQDLDTTAWNANLAGLVLDYQQADFRQTDRLTYLTPKFNGFQAGVSYAPYPGTSMVGSSVSGPQTNSIAGAFKDPWDVAARWDGAYQGVAMSVGAGYSYASDQSTTGLAAGAVGTDALKTYNFGANVAMQGFSLGGAYKHSNNGMTSTVNGNSNTAIYDIGAGYDNGPYHAGLSYFHEKFGAGLLGVGAGKDATVHRYALGGGYTFGPGMTFRGAVDWGSYEPTGAAHTNFQQVTLGTDIQF